MNKNRKLVLPYCKIYQVCLITKDLIISYPETTPQLTVYHRTYVHPYCIKQCRRQYYKVALLSLAHLSKFRDGISFNSRRGKTADAAQFRLLTSPFAANSCTREHCVCLTRGKGINIHMCSLPWLPSFWFEKAVLFDISGNHICSDKGSTFQQKNKM